MKIKINGYFPFSVMAESKTSKAGNAYLSIGISQAVKDQSGQYQSVWLNMIDKRDLLTLASACEIAYHKISAEEAKEREQSKAQNTGAPVAQTVEDDIPF